MITLQLKQGTQAWHRHRATHHNASDASALMGKSPYRTRSQLIAERATGVREEISLEKQRLFDKGHAAESTARSLAEAIVGDELFPVVGISDENPTLSASFDGLTMLGDTAWEHKLWNESKAEDVRNGHIPDCDWWQVVQQAVVSDAKRILYMVSDGTRQKMEYVMIDGDQARKCAGSLLQAWDQFEADVAAYEAPESSRPEVVANTAETLPSISVQVSGSLSVIDNFDAFEGQLRHFLDDVLITEPKTDQDFVDLDNQIKVMKKAEAALDAAESQLLAQVESVDTAKHRKDLLYKLTRDNRLMAEKLLKTEKERRKADIVNAAYESVREHYNRINDTMPPAHVLAIGASVRADIGAAIKGLKTLKSITDAADTAAANLKIEVSQQADKVRAAIKVLDEFSDHGHLFADRVLLCATKPPEDLRNLAKARVAEYEERERHRLDAERERIRAEEQAKAEQAAKNDQERGDDPSTVALSRGGESQEAPTPPSFAGLDEREESSIAKPGTPYLVKLSDIQKAIAPLSITAAGLKELCGVEPTDVPGRAKFYRLDKVYRAINEMAVLLSRAGAYIDEHVKDAA